MNTPRPKNRRLNKTVEDLIDFIEERSESFTRSPTYIKNYRQDSDEDHLTELLIWHIGDKNSGKYMIISQTKQEGRRKVDIGIGLHGGMGSYIFCLEAKFLPNSPVDYVTGEYAAIKRFKAMQHGLNNCVDRKPLMQNGIIAYVKSGTFENHLNEINGQIEKISAKHSLEPDEYGLIWNKSEQLMKIYFKSIAKLFSKHPRAKAPDVRLHHFWIGIN